MNILLEAGADPNAGNIEYEITPLFVAANEGNNQAIKPLLSYGARTHLGVDRESIWTQVLTEKMFHTLLREGVDPLLNDQWGRNALHHAAMGGFAKIVRKLIKTYHVDVNCIDNYGSPALMTATYHKHTNVCRLLLKLGADVSLGNNSMTTGYLIPHPENKIDEEKSVETTLILKEAMALKRREDLGKILDSNQSVSIKRPNKPNF